MLDRSPKLESRELFSTHRLSREQIRAFRDG
jgi:hypothetical protein